MSATEQYRLCAVALGTTVIGQIVDEEYSEEVSELLAADTGGLYNRGSGQDVSDVRLRFTTQQVKTALATVPLTGLKLSTDNAVAYFAKVEQGGGLQANACVTVTLALGIAIRVSESARDGLAAETIEIIGVSADGTTHPAVKATGVAVPTTTAAEMYVAGGSSGVQGHDIDWGVAAAMARGDGDVFFTQVGIPPAGIQPRVRWSQKTFPALGLATNLTTVTLREVSQGGGRGASPITHTFNQSQAHPRRVGGSDVTAEYELTPTFDGTNAPIVTTGLS